MRRRVRFVAFNSLRGRGVLEHAEGRRRAPGAHAELVNVLDVLVRLFGREREEVLHHPESGNENRLRRVSDRHARARPSIRFPSAPCAKFQVPGSRFQVEAVVLLTWNSWNLERRVYFPCSSVTRAPTAQLGGQSLALLRLADERVDLLSLF